MIELVNNNIEMRSIKEMTELLKAMIKALRNREQIAIVCPVDNDSRTLRNLAELLFLETDVKNKNYIKYFDSRREKVEVGDIFAFFSWYINERSCCIIWEEAQNFTSDAWTYAAYKTDDLEFKSIFLVDSSTKFAFFVPSSVRTFYFNQLEIFILRDVLQRRLRIERYGLNLSMDDLYRYGILINPARLTRLTFNTRYKEATVSNNMIFKIASKEENNMKIVGVYSNEKKGRTTIKFADGRVVSVQCDKEDKFDVHKGIAMALAKAAFGSKVLQECLSSYSEQKSGEENKKAKKARKEKAKAKQENDIKEEE